MKGRINYLRLILAAGLAIVLIGGSFALLYLLFAQKDDGLTYEMVNIQAGNDYVVSGGYLTYATDTGLIQYQLESSRVTQTKLSSPVDGFDVSASMTAVYAGSAFQLKNYDVLNLSGTIRSVSCGTHYCAVLRTSQTSGMDSIILFNASGEAVGNPIDFTDTKVVSFGFDTVGGRETLWVITLNTEASLPVTNIRLYDYNNGGTMSYYPTFYDQSIEKLAFTDESVFLIGTQDIIRYSQSGSREQYRVKIYGKEVVDYRQSGDYVYFLLKPRGESNAHTLYVLALAEGDAANATSMTLYVGEEVVRAYLASSGVRIVTGTRFLSYTFAGRRSKDLELEHPASYAVALDTGRFLLVSGTDCYICTDT